MKQVTRTQFWIPFGERASKANVFTLYGPNLVDGGFHQGKGSVQRFHAPHRNIGVHQFLENFSGSEQRLF